MSNLPPLSIYATTEKEWQRQREVTKAWEDEVDRLRTRVAELEAELAALKSTPTFPDNMHGKPVAARMVSEFNYDMNTAPKGGKLLVLNEGDVATIAMLSDSNKKHFKAWAPLPKKRRKHS